jgi:hypothetical protein
MLLVNVNTKQFIPSAGSNFIQPVESRDQIIYGTRVEVRFQLYNPDGTVFALNESDTFCCAGDINFIHTDDLMFYSGHEMCRIIDAAQGIVGVTIDATSDSFADKATSQNTRMYVQLKRHVAGDTLGDTVLQDIVYAQPAVMTTEGAPASSDPEYMTAAATLALFRTAPDYQFSADGETGWHDEQDIAADRFYRERRNGGEWGPAIELIEGKTGPTGAAAGFGTPTIAVETLPAGSDATASVTASGDDTAKVFSFNFGIPKGADGKNGTDGKAGADGVSSYTYVAYASDASGAGFSLTPSNALKFRAEIHTTTAIETPDAEDFAGATWVKYLGDDGTGAGDMTKSVYDTNDDGIVDHAATADAVGATTAAQVADAVGKAHAHANKATLDKFGESGGKPTYNGKEIGGASNWNDITGKPETFPPSAHNHAITDVTGLEDALQNAGSVKSVNGQLPDESGNVTVETGGAVDESRLLPENPANGDIPCFDTTATVGGGNDANTRLLLQPSTSDHGIVDQAAGNAAPVTLENHNVTVDEEGNMVFDGSNAYLKIPANTLPSDFFNGTDEWTLDIVYNVASKDMQCLFGCSSSLRMDFLLNSGGTLQIGGGPNLGTGWQFNEDVHLTFEIYKDGTVWKYTIFRNGSVVTTGTWVNADWRSVDQYIGWEGGTDSRKINGKIKALRLTSGALHKGAAFQSDYPWTKPQTVGEWGKLNKSELVKSVNGQTPDSSGAVTLPEATTSAAGLMAAADKAKLDSLNITESKARPGYFKLPGGTIVQWGAASNITADGSTQITFPVAFPNAFLIGNATTVSGNASASGVVVSLTSVTVTGMTLIIKNHPGNSNDINVHWLAIGY